MGPLRSVCNDSAGDRGICRCRLPRQKVNKSMLDGCGLDPQRAAHKVRSWRFKATCSTLKSAKGLLRFREVR